MGEVVFAIHVPEMSGVEDAGFAGPLSELAVPL
jgi:hypothetical protein